MALLRRIGVGRTGLAEATVRILHAAQPGRCVLAEFGTRNLQGFGGAQDAAGPVDVVHAPSSVPRPVSRLLTAQIRKGPSDHGIVRRPPEPRQAFDDARRHIGCRWIDHRVVIRERYLRQDCKIVVAVERPPAAVTVLHAGQPCQGAPRRLVHSRAIRMSHALERHQYKRRIVEVWIEIVSELERPPARIDVGILDLPVAGTEDLAVKQPVGRLDECRIIERHSGLLQGDHRDRGIPDR